MPNDPRSPTNPSRQPGQTVRFSFPKVVISELTALSTSIADSVAIKQSTLAELSKSIAASFAANEVALTAASKSITAIALLVVHRASRGRRSRPTAST
jgi:hypothetical protein